MGAYREALGEVCKDLWKHCRIRRPLSDEVTRAATRGFDSARLPPPVSIS